MTEKSKQKLTAESVLESENRDRLNKNSKSIFKIYLKKLKETFKDQATMLIFIVAIITMIISLFGFADFYSFFFAAFILMGIFLVIPLIRVWIEKTSFNEKC